jgi:hypothetical protein
VTVFGPIPASLVRTSIEAEEWLEPRSRDEVEPSVGHVAGFGGWDSMTMALMA